MRFRSRCFSRNMEKSLQCGNHVPYRGKNAVWPTQKPFLCGHFVAATKVELLGHRFGFRFGKNTVLEPDGDNSIVLSTVTSVCMAL